MSYKVTIAGVNTESIPKIGRKESEELLMKIEKGDREARSYFLFCNQRLVLSVLHRFDFDSTLSDDVFQVGCLGLTKALNNFDPTFGVTFSTYAVPMIIGEIRRFLRENTALKVSRKMRDIAYLVTITRKRYAEEGKKEPTIEEIAADIGVSTRSICESLDALAAPVSLYDPAYNDGDECVLVMDQIADGNVKEPDWVEKLDLSSALGSLSPKERNVIELRYYQGKTQTEVSKFCNVSQAQISRLENSAIKKMRAYLE